MWRVSKALKESLLNSNGSVSYSRGVSEICATDNEEQIKKKLQWYFKSPYEKFKDRGRKPWKFVLQIFKIILVTVQALVFATDEFSLVTFNKDNIETFRQLFLVDYPVGDFDAHSLYRKEAVYQHIYYTWQQYYNYEKIMIGSYENVKSSNETYSKIMFCEIRNEKMKSLFLPNKTVSENKEVCYPLLPPNNTASKNMTMKEFIKINKIPDCFQWTIEMSLKFSFQVNYTMLHSKNSPDCYMFDIVVLFDNSDLDGIMKVTLDSSVDFHLCRDINDDGLHIREHDEMRILISSYDIFIIILCLISFALCIRSFRRHYKICMAASKFFVEYRHEPFTLSDKMNFVSFWLVLITLSDVSTITGSTIKVVLDWLEYPELYAACSMCFGFAVLFSWIGILRYLGFLKGYNALLITLKTAFPTIIRFITCVAFIYVGFTVCGWIVFGPYHTKFRNLYTTSECLFALINGDDMYATFSGMDSSDKLIWYFSKIYLYVFISLFIFVVLSLFIGIMADTYERIKDYGHPPKTRIELFMEGNEHSEGERRHRPGTVLCSHHYDEEEVDYSMNTSPYANLLSRQSEDHNLIT